MSRLCARVVSRSVVLTATEAVVWCSLNLCPHSDSTGKQASVLVASEHVSSTVMLDEHNSIRHAFEEAEHTAPPEQNIACPQLKILYNSGEDESAGEIRLIEKLLTPAECQAIISQAQRHGFSRPGQFDQSTRDCERLHTVDVAMSDEMMQRLRGYLPEIIRVDGVRWRLHRFTHHWRYVEYQSGGHFRPHYDGAKMMPYKMTCFTVQVYLDDDFVGGRTRFYMDYEAERMASHAIEDGKGCHRFRPEGPPTHAVDPSTGSALVFSHVHNVLHDGEPVAKGVKHIMRGDVLYEALPEDIPMLRNPSLPPSMRMFCSGTAARHGTRNYVGQVWLCACAEDGHGCKHADVIAAATDESMSNFGPACNAHCARIDEAHTSMKFVLISGKRAAGKDHVATLLVDALEAQGQRVSRVALGSINKRAFADKMGIDLERLRNDRVFKETHRLAMIDYHARRNQEDPEWCLKEALETATEARADVLLLSDWRTREDFQYFARYARNSDIFTVRIDASDEARSARGWIPDARKDTSYTEVGLDDWKGWGACVDNSDNTSVGAHMLSKWVESTVLPRIQGWWD